MVLIRSGCNSKQFALVHSTRLTFDVVDVQSQNQTKLNNLFFTKISFINGYWRWFELSVESSLSSSKACCNICVSSEPFWKCAKFLFKCLTTFLGRVTCWLKLRMTSRTLFYSITWPKTFRRIAILTWSRLFKVFSMLSSYLWRNLYLDFSIWFDRVLQNNVIVQDCWVL